MKKITLKIAAIAVVAASMLSLSSCGSPALTTAANTGLEALMLTNDQIIGTVKQSVAKMDAANKVSPANSAYTKRLNNLIGGITHVGDIPLNFKVYETKEVNAFACADGSVRVYSGLMDIMNDDELLGILGHEIGHVAMEHSKNAVKQQIINGALIDVITSSTGNIGAVLNDSQLLSIANAYSSAKFSRKQENEADDFGYEFIKGAGRNPYTLVEAFEKMQKLENSSNPNAASYFQKMFSSHPETTERIARITQRCIADGFTRPTKK